jgi:hypothetical protein
MLVINQRNERYRYHVYVEPSVKYSTLYNSEKVLDLWRAAVTVNKKAKIIGK